MYPEELEALRHVALDPGQQGADACFPGLPERALPVLGDVTVFPAAVSLERVVPGKSLVAKLTGHGGGRYGLARAFSARRL